MSDGRGGLPAQSVTRTRGRHCVEAVSQMAAAVPHHRNAVAHEPAAASHAPTSGDCIPTRRQRGAAPRRASTWHSYASHCRKRAPRSMTACLGLDAVLLSTPAVKHTGSRCGRSRRPGKCTVRDRNVTRQLVAHGRACNGSSTPVSRRAPRACDAPAATALPRRTVARRARALRGAAQNMPHPRRVWHRCVLKCTQTHGSAPDPPSARCQRLAHRTAPVRLRTTGTSDA